MTDEPPDTSLTPASVIASRQRQLGTALHLLAKDLARERRSIAELERELARLRQHPSTDRVERPAATETETP
jgi:hypothetical protein